VRKTRELAAMRRAIVISAQGLGATSPNPPVGCVILDPEGSTVGEGYHVRKGEAHAEVNALTAAGKFAKGGTAVVTLEPCNHFGRTPPCREALINAGIGRVLIAVMDPTSRGEGGAALLREAGVEVEQDFLRDEALLVLTPWLSSLQRNRPFITWTYQATPDGAPLPLGEHSGPPGGFFTMKESYDLVISQGGRVAEGGTGQHGREVFRVPRDPLSGNAVKILTLLSQAGARSALLHGASDIASLLFAAGVVDRIIVYLPATPNSWSPDAQHGQLGALPAGYRLVEVTRQGDYVRLTGSNE
jgi:diaminohydroxyphosphoribosylaminopyrimidine deaminase/5-amino-6-(5-phosphoribosylamino)uracil reductase